MALSGNTVWEVRNTADFANASDTNGGGFVTGASGTDYSFASIPTGGGAKYALTNGQYVSGSAILTASASADMIGNIAYIAGGTGSMTGGWYQITGQTTGTSLTLDRSTGLVAGTGITINIGGALATPGQLAVLITVSGMLAWIKYSATAFTLTTSTAGPGGQVAFVTGSVITIEGYDQTRGDRTGNKPTISWGSVTLGSNTYALTTSITGGGFACIENIAIDAHNVANGSCVLGANNRVLFKDCNALNASTSGTYGINGLGFIISCYANNCTAGFNNNYFCYGCTAVSCATGFASVSVKCIAISCTIGFSCTITCLYSNCTADSCVKGFSGNQGVMIDCIASNCSSYGYYAVGNCYMCNCSVYNNITNVNGIPLTNSGFITLTNPPYSSGGPQFAPNATAGGGASLRGAAIGVFSQTDNTDIGAVQHADPSIYVINTIINHYLTNEGPQ